MELRQLRSFVAVAEELHFRRAAEQLHLSQPSVSQQVRTLEDELGVQLFDRNRRGVALTPAGAALLDDARDVLARAARAAERAREAGSGSRGRLRLSLTRSLTGGLAGAIVEAFRARYPDVALELSVGNTILHAEQLRHGLIDVAFVRPPLLDPGIEELELAREPLVCVLPHGAPAGPPPRDRPRRPARRAARVVAARPRPGTVGGDAAAVYGEGRWPAGHPHRARGGAARAPPWPRARA